MHSQVENTTISSNITQRIWNTNAHHTDTLNKNWKNFQTSDHISHPRLISGSDYEKLLGTPRQAVISIKFDSSKVIGTNQAHSRASSDTLFTFWSTVIPSFSNPIGLLSLIILPSLIYIISLFSLIVLPTLIDMIGMSNPIILTFPSDYIGPFKLIVKNTSCDRIS